MKIFFFTFFVAMKIIGADIYPDDHWKYSEKLTTSNFDEVVKSNVDNGKTLFVRWIASSG